MNSMDAVHIEMQRMQMELQRRDMLIEEQQKRIFQLEDEVMRCNKQIQDLMVQLANYNPKTETASSKPSPSQSRYWTAEEHERFIEAVQRYGSKDVKAISQFVATRSPAQVRTHAQKYYLKLERERKRSGEFDTKSSVDLNPDAEGMSEYDDVMQAQKTLDDLSKKSPRKRTESPSQAAPKPQEKAAVVHSTKQQLQAAAPVVSQAKGWTTQEYNTFIEGLLAFPEERDISKKCKLISERFLPKYTPEDIKQCYAILHNYIQNMTEEADSSKRPKTEAYASAVSSLDNFAAPTTTTSPMDKESETNKDGEEARRESTDDVKSS